MTAIANPVPGFTVTDEHRRLLDTQGFFFTPVLFDAPTIAGVRGEFQRLWDQNVAWASKQDKITHHLAKTRPFLSQLDRKSPVCDAFCRHEAFMNLCRSLVGADADMTWNQAIIKAPEGGDNSFGWHQDQWYAEVGGYANDCDLNMLRDNNNAITIWAAISETTVENGTLWVLPGRHREGLLPHLWSDERREWQGQYDTSTKVPAVLHPGQVLVFRRYLPHASGANITQSPRMAYQIGYSSPGLKLKPSIDLTPVLRAGRPVNTG